MSGCFRVALAVGVTLLLCGCAHFDAAPADVATADSESYENMPPVVVEGSDAPPVEAAVFDPSDVSDIINGSVEPYLLDTGDRLRIFVYGQPNLSRLYTVDQTGNVSVPLIGTVKARGKTTTELEHTIRGRLGSEFVKDPQVTVDIQQNRPFFILGEVRNGGQFPFVSGMTVRTAVAIAGGYSDRASEQRVRISRKVDGVAIEFEAGPTDDVLPGDTIYVTERFF